MKWGLRLNWRCSLEKIGLCGQVAVCGGGGAPEAAGKPEPHYQTSTTHSCANACLYLPSASIKPVPTHHTESALLIHICLYLPRTSTTQYHPPVKLHTYISVCIFPVRQYQYHPVPLGITKYRRPPTYANVYQARWKLTTSKNRLK